MWDMRKFEGNQGNLRNSAFYTFQLHVGLNSSYFYLYNVLIP